MPGKANTGRYTKTMRPYTGCRVVPHRWRQGPIATRMALIFLSMLCLAILANGGHSAQAQSQYGVDVWTVDQGLPQNLVRGLAQSPDGYLWIATFDGLVRFDGIRFTTFGQSNTPGIASNRFGSMYQGKDGDLWLINETGGLTRYHDGSFRTYGVNDGVPGDLVDGITGDQAGNTWILAADRIAQWDAAQGRFAEIAPAQPKFHYIPTIWQSGGFWGRDTTNLHLFVRGQFLTYPLPPELLHSSIWGVALDQQGMLWVETLDGRRITVETTKAGLPSFTAAPSTVTYFGSDGHPWEMRVGHRLSRSLDVPSSGKLETIPVTHFFEDRQANLWLGTEGQGLYRLQRQSVRVYSQEQGLADRDAYGIYQDSTDAIWIGAWHIGLSRLKDGKFTTYTVADGLPALLVTALEEDRDGRLWVGTHGGLVVFDHGRFRKPDVPTLPDRSVVQAIHQDRSGAMWFGTNRGLVRYEQGASTLFSTRDGMAGDDIHVIIEDHTGDLWIGGFGGLTRFHDGHTTRWSERDGLPGNNIWSIYEDRDGVLWIGTYSQGLGRLQNGRFTSFTEQEGLFNNGVFQILEDAKSNLWISCNRGIYRVSKRELNGVAAGDLTSVHSTAYGKTDGMFDPECNGGIWPAGIKARDGKLWFPTEDGAAVIDPEKVIRDPEPPPVIIESVSLDGAASPVTTALHIAPGHNNLEIHYTAPSFIKAEQIRFRYKLQGLQSDWVDAGSRRTAYYSHLPPGDYTFRVIAENSSGIWNSQGESLAVSVAAPFYKTTWFSTLLLLCGAALLLMFSNHRVAQLRRAKAAQQAFSQQLIASQESERKRIAAELHDSLGQRLVVINNLALFFLKAQRQSPGGTVELESIEEISTEASMAMEETRSISYNLRPFQLDRLGLTKSIEALIRTASKSSGIRFVQDLANVDDAFPEEMRINFYRIVQEGVNNIMRHSQATEAFVRVVRQADQVVLTMQDNGRGFVPSSRPREKPQGGGFGMTGMVERASLLGGTWKVDSAPGNGTVITVQILLGGNSHG
jgi:signal transduction histidine kinase/ligand-binding sensor domain-containing protein